MRMKLRAISVSPVIPEPLASLRKLSENLAWEWMPELSSIFEAVDPELWEQSGHNPVLLLGRVEQKKLEALANDSGFLARLDAAKAFLERYLNSPTHPSANKDLSIAYFSAEFGITGCLPIYSGGLGILAGDHLKSASDLGLPLMGVGLLYQEGYFRQYLNADGWQGETYPPNDFFHLPIRQAKHDNGAEVRVSVEFPGRDVVARVWRADVGRVPLFLLDTNVPENSDADRRITRALYSGGVELRIQQLMILGIGGFRALVEMGLEPAVCHMNEGHAGFLGVERTRFLMQDRGMSYEVARDIVDDGNIFTTHTPVPAGFDVFSRELIERHMTAYVQKVGISLEDFIALGRRNKKDSTEPLNMAVLAIRHAAMRNGVSKLHGQISRKLVHTGGGWKDWPEEEIPIDWVTNGVHTPSWIAPEMRALFERHIGADWHTKLTKQGILDEIDAIDDRELWQTHVDLRRQLVEFARKRVRWQLERRGTPSWELDGVDSLLNPDALTIGFARRFATYKRATLLFSDPDRLERIISATGQPMQFVFAGKAHPADQPAKELIKKIITLTKEKRFASSIVFLEDYDIAVAKRLVRGTDVWLNTPQRPREASGTSGMKVIPNACLNLSILDGWWAEAYEPGLGWAIGMGEDHDQTRDEVEANALYSLLETQVQPAFFQRDSRGVPLKWVAMMKASMSHLTARFSSDRMVSEYLERFYVPTQHRFKIRSGDDNQTAESIVAWKQKVKERWADVRILEVKSNGFTSAKIAKPFPIRAKVHLGALSPDDVDVQLYHGILDAKEELHEASTVSMQHVGTADSNGTHEYFLEMAFGSSGRHGYTVRVIPRHPEVLVPNEIVHIRWAES